MQPYLNHQINLNDLSKRIIKKRDSFAIVCIVFTFIRRYKALFSSHLRPVQGLVQSFYNILLWNTGYIFKTKYLGSLVQMRPHI